MNIFEKLAVVKTMPELDALRMETVAAMQAAGELSGEAGFKKVQAAFIKAKNRLRRIPLVERTW